MNIAIVTGASSGIGKEFVKQLSADSSLDEIWMIARDFNRLSEASQQISTTTRLFSIALNDCNAYTDLVSALAQSKPTVSVLVNSAGFGKNGDFSEIDIQDQMEMVDLNCRAVVQMTQIVLPFMSEGSTIYNISSISGFAPLGAFAVYGASKAFVNSFSLALRAELKKEKITVLTVTPGSVETNFQNISRGKSKREKKLFAKKSSAADVVKRALIDGRKGRVYSLFGKTANLARLLRRILPHRFVAKLSHTKIYPKK